MVDESLIEFAEKLHGHLSPGVALGMRMAEVALNMLNTDLRGKGLTGISETKMCLPDALQVVAGTTAGNKNLIIKDFGKLAIALVLNGKNTGYRISLKKEAADASVLSKKFIYRLGKLNKIEERELANFFLNLDESYFNISRIELTDSLKDKKMAIVECDLCGELQPENYIKIKDGKKICKICTGENYFKLV